LADFLYLGNRELLGYGSWRTLFQKLGDELGEIADTADIEYSTLIMSRLIYIIKKVKIVNKLLYFLLLIVDKILKAGFKYLKRDKFMLLNLKSLWWCVWLFFISIFLFILVSI
jgi:uncharacterized membrane protein